ncbi:MAG: hypothetical protein AB1512_07905 [Thermodesulfobacteriota bacterium]
MSYPRAMGLGMFTLVFLFLPGYIWIRIHWAWTGWETFWTCAGALVPWTVACIIIDFLLNLFRKESEFPGELLHAPLFVLYFGIPAILLYEWIGLKWFLVIAGIMVGMFAVFGLAAAFLARRYERRGQVQEDAPSPPPPGIG